MKNKKIFIILPHLGGGGAEKSTLYLVNDWVKKNYVVYLILMNKKGELLSKLDSKVKIIDLNCNRIYKTFLPCYKLIKLYKPDVILTLMWPLTSVIFFAWIFSFKRGKLFLADHNPFINEWFQDFKINKMLFILSYNLTYLFASGIICVSKNIKNEIKKILLFKKNNIYHIYNPVKYFDKNSYDIKYFKKILFNQSKYCFLSVGRLKKSRDVITVLEAFKNFKHLNDSRLVILGDGPEKNNLMKYVKNNNIHNYVEFKGFVEDTYKYYCAADLYIHSSLYDAMPLTLIEALVCNTKILSTDCKYGPREILKKDNLGIIIKTNDTNEMLKGFDEALNTKIDTIKREQMKNEFLIENISKQYLKVFFN